MVDGGRKKTCLICRTEKPIDEFAKDGRSHDGHRNQCEQCLSGFGSATALAPTGVKAATVAPINTGRRNIAPQTYFKLFDQQHGACAICRQPEATKNEYGETLRLSFYGSDLNGHIVRGLVCKLCNMGLSMFKDSPVLLSRAIEFLTRRPLMLEAEIRLSRE